MSVFLFEVRPLGCLWVIQWYNGWIQLDGGFLGHRDTPKSAGVLRENPNLKWVMTRGTPMTQEMSMSKVFRNFPHRPGGTIDIHQPGPRDYEKNPMWCFTNKASKTRSIHWRSWYPQYGNPGIWITQLVQGNNYRKPPYVMRKSLVSGDNFPLNQFIDIHRRNQKSLKLSMDNHYEAVPPR